MRFDVFLTNGKFLVVTEDTEKILENIVHGKAITSYNVGFDFGKFLYQEPWNLKWITARRYDIMDLATKKVMSMARSDSIGDKKLQERLLFEEANSPYHNKWVRSEDAYRVLCPDDPMDLEKQTHRALDDAVMEAWILKIFIEK